MLVEQRGPGGQEPEPSGVLPADPLRSWMVARLTEAGVWDPLTGACRNWSLGESRVSLKTLCFSWGIGERRAREILYREKAGGTVHVSVVDRIFCRAGDPYLLTELYGDVLDEQAAGVVAA